MKYKCLVCGTVADIDKENKTMIREAPAIKHPKPGKDHRLYAFTFPSHPDCELAKPIDEIRLEALKEVDHTFKHET